MQLTGNALQPIKVGEGSIAVNSQLILQRTQQREALMLRTKKGRLLSLLDMQQVRAYRRPGGFATQQVRLSGASGRESYRPGSDPSSDLSFAGGRRLVRRHHAPAGPGRKSLRLDLTRDPLPPADVVLCRDGLVHFAFADTWRALANLRRSGARYLVTTTFIGDRENEDIATGGWRPLNLERPPFFLPEPQRLIDERCWHTGGIYVDKRLGIWLMGDVPVPG